MLRKAAKIDNQIKRNHGNNEAGLENELSVWHRAVNTFSEHHSLISGELGLDGLSRKILSALPQVPLGAPQTTEAPEIGTIPSWGFW